MMHKMQLKFTSFNVDETVKPIYFYPSRLYVNRVFLHITK